jgi:uncharacterized protein YlaI
MPYFTLIDNIKCFECGEHVPFESLEDHMVRFHGYVKCSLCNQVFNIQKLDEHNNRYHQLKKNNYSNIFNCAECNAEISLLEYGQHLLLKHDFAECGICGILCSQKAFDKHMMESHKQAKCDVCQDYCENLEAHLLEKHQKTICTECELLISAQDILFHLKEIHGYIICEICKTPIKPSGLEGHMRAHDMSMCPACSGFYLNQVLEQHLLESHNKKI